MCIRDSYDRVDHNDGKSTWRYELNWVRQLLIAGEMDKGGNLYGYAKELASKMVNTPGRCMFIRNTGHSIHDERPRYLAEQIVRFLTVEAG